MTTKSILQSTLWCRILITHETCSLVIFHDEESTGLIFPNLVYPFTLMVKTIMRFIDMNIVKTTEILKYESSKSLESRVFSL